ncbi:S1C family serine protease [Terrarubrum flagellatum]|uniref:S1C family serine protease n=1 Tax=Terrirubrum flagellatum TaxID=2895980 RepID=UPI00314515A9
MDLDSTRRSIVTVHSVIPEDGFTASSLGTEREGSGVVINENGLVLTIGYLITEAENIWLTTVDGRVIQGHALAYDQETGFGLVQALGKLDLPALDLGKASEAKAGDRVVLSGGGQGQSSRATIVGKQEFAGYWEYLLDEAIFTAPAHNWWGGAALIDANGKLLGVGSLFVQRVTDTGRQQDMNMIVPIDLLPPILGDLLAYGQVNKPPRPWLGVYSAESDGKVVIASVSEKGPAAAAGLREGDVISSVRDASVESLADFYRKVWGSGAAGVEIPIEVVRDGRSVWRRVKSADRGSYLKKPKLH